MSGYFLCSHLKNAGIPMSKRYVSFGIDWWMMITLIYVVADSVSNDVRSATRTPSVDALFFTRTMLQQQQTRALLIHMINVQMNTLPVQSRMKKWFDYDVRYLTIGYD